MGAIWVGIIIAEVPIFTGALFSALWFSLRRHMAEADERDDKIEALERSMAIGDRERAATAALADRTDRRTVQLGETMATVAAFVNRHERFHESHP